MDKVCEGFHLFLGSLNCMASFIEYTSTDHVSLKDEFIEEIHRLDKMKDNNCGGTKTALTIFYIVNASRCKCMI